MHTELNMTGSVGLLLCSHCGTPVSARSLSNFCCLGCETVYTILQNRGLSQYYSLKKNSTSLRKPQPATEVKESFSYLDDPEFIRLYSEDSGETMRFYLEGVHCVACVWLVEKLPDWLDDIHFIRLDLGNAVATVKRKPSGSFKRVAEELRNLGYRPHAIKDGEAEILQKKENRKLLIQLAVAGACTGNIMLLAVALYAGASGTIADVFRWTSLVLCLPVVLYSAIPFYRSALTALKKLRPSIDVPIVLGVAFAFIASVFNLILGSDHVYFDSVAALIFLLLSSRYVLKKTQQKAIQASNLLHFLTPSVARKRNSTTLAFEEVRVESLKPNDEIQIYPGDSIPVDGLVAEGSSHLNQALMTGESNLVAIGPGSLVLAGSVNQEHPLVIKVQQSGSETRLGRILTSLEESLTRRAPIVAFADRVSQIFTLVVLSFIGLAFYLGYQTSWEEGFDRALALALVTCPCAFALATPLAMTLSISKAAKNGILIKGPDVLENLARIKTVFLDKTGTLTRGHFEVIHWIADAEFKEAAEVVVALESRSAHPIAKALVRHFREDTRPLAPVTVESFEEKLGWGVSGQIGSHFYEISKAPSGNNFYTTIAVSKDGKRVATASLGDKLREDSKKAVAQLQALKLEVNILSGDRQSAVQSVARDLGISQKNTYFDATPEFKALIAKDTPQSLMVGDGANDAVALASAKVGIAVHSGMEVSLRAADIYQCTPGVVPIAQSVVLSRETLKIIYRNFGFSVLYNLIGGFAALQGWVDPLFAAILMPLSALTVFCSSLVGTRVWRRVFLEGTS